MAKKNKRGDVPITILVIGVFALCSLALFTFFVADFKMGNSFVGVSVMQKMDTAIDEYGFYLNSGISPEVAQSFFPTIDVGEKRYIYYDIKKSSFFSSSGDEEIMFSVRYPVR